MMLSNRETAERIAELMPEDKWYSGKEPFKEGTYCLGMALAEVSDYSFGRNRTLDDIIFRLFPERASQDAPYYRVTIPTFNDHRDTTYEDVMLVVKHLSETPDVP